MKQRLCVLQHADGIGLGCMEQWFKEHEFDINTVRVDRGEPLPPLNSFDWLAIMGGPMGVYEEAQYPWLKTEKQWLRTAIDTDKKILGVCMGGQLIASALGAEVYPAESAEIGWFPINRTDASASWLPPQSCLLSWHGDQFKLPSGGKPFASSEATPNQGFRYGDNIWALQFHVEAQTGTTDIFLEATGGELPAGEYVQSKDQLDRPDCVATSAKVANKLLNFMAAM